MMKKMLFGRVRAALVAVADRALSLVAPVRADERIEIEFAAPTHVAAPTPVEAKPSPAILAFAREAELAAARKRCMTALENVRRRQRKAGLPLEASPKFRAMSIEQLAALEAEYREKIADLAERFPTPESAAPTQAVALPKVEPTEVVETKAEETVVEAAPAEVVETKKVEAVEKTPQPEYGEARRLLAGEYVTLLRELAQLRKVKDLRELAHYHPEPTRVTKRNLRGLIARVKAEVVETKAEQAAAAERKKREAEEREATLLKEYNAARAKGAKLPPFNRWKRQQLLGKTVAA